MLDDASYLMEQLGTDFEQHCRTFPVLGLKKLNLLLRLRPIRDSEKDVLTSVQSLLQKNLECWRAI